MKKLWKRLIWITVGLVILAMVVVAFLPKPVMVDTARVARGPMQVTIEAEGETRVHDRFVIAAPVTGRLARVDLTEGDVVGRGSVVATILPPPLDPLQREQLEKRIDAAGANFRQATTQAEGLKASLAQAERERERMRSLESVGSVSKQDRERAEMAATAAAKELESARYRAQAAAFAVEEAKAGRAAYTVQGSGGGQVALRSPVSGRVLRVMEQSERLVPAGTPVMQVGDPSGLEIVADLLSSDAVRVEPGAAVMIEGWGGEKPLRARVRYVEPSAFTKVSALGVEEQRVNVIAELVELEPRLGDGFRVDAKIVLWESPSVLKVPASALFRAEGGWSVFVVTDGVARRVAVKLGQRNSFEAEVLGGIPEGAEVIVHPSDQIVDGVKVEVAAPSAAKSGS